MTSSIENRDKVMVDSLRRELVGPSPSGDELDCSGTVDFADRSQAFRPYRQATTGEEILQRDRPTKRYGVAVLYPLQSAPSNDDIDSGAPNRVGDDGPDAQVLDQQALGDLERIAARQNRSEQQRDLPDDLDLSLANLYRPSCMAVSFLARIGLGDEMRVSATGGRYKQKDVTVEGSPRMWWLRSSVTLDCTYTADHFDVPLPARIMASDILDEGTESLDLRIEVYARPADSAGLYLITVCLVNRTSTGNCSDEQALFQSGLTVSFARRCILQYPSPPPADEEEESLSLLFRHRLTFAIGHGCAADWSPPDLLVDGAAAVSSVMAAPMPAYEVPPVTPDITDEQQVPITASMRALAGLDPNDDGFAALDRLVSEYEAWINSRSAELAGLPNQFHLAGRRHLDMCSACAQRMRDGLSYLRNDSTAREAFRLANLAILIQQVRARREPRLANFDASAAKVVFDDTYETTDLSSERACACAWRAFQISFLLMSLRSAVRSDDEWRRFVELIWFPTGGGKTEAYLGLAAFTMFFRRLRDPNDCGVEVLMRYTLRLLTAQQFERASRLICAMEDIRQSQSTSLGDLPFTIGIWLGGTTTPNTQGEALLALRELQNSRRDVENPFVVDRCPWCGAQMGPVRLRAPKGSRAPRVLGYTRRDNSVALCCSDSRCPFSGGLPILVVDEDIYECPPSFLIGTVDKFAMLAWKPQARAIFGIGVNGNRVASPPGLVIQDELHLISGPLGSLAGLYEAVIEELCTDRRSSPASVPKIVSSTATIRNYQDQVLALFARAETCLFPPPGLEADESFFATVRRADDGTTARGKLFVGVHAPGLGSLQTVQVRVLSSLLQAPVELNSDDRDPWWTLLMFFNSLRELGTTVSLFQSDIPDYLKAIRQRYNLDFRAMRRLRGILELTGRLQGHEVKPAISALEVTTTSSNQRPVDVCLASNIIEVGVDIDRLSLMVVVGQPKTTAQYIQVTGRVGRRADRPGLVVTIYGASKPRDRSHFEKFRTYHDSLYAQVEPTSVTPFSEPALDRALHAVVATFLRQTGDSTASQSPYSISSENFEEIERLLDERVRVVDPDEHSTLRSVLVKRIAEIGRWNRLLWDGPLDAEDIPLLRPAGAYVAPEHAIISWATPQSMRHVDAECQAEISQLYMLDEEVSDA